MSHDIHTSQLDTFVADCDSLGGIQDPRIGERFYGFKLIFDTQVDQSLDPFSAAYVDAQIRLYEEIAGRPLDQATGEMTRLDVDAHVRGPNPYNTRDGEFIAKHASAVLTLLRIANPPVEAHVLDLGCGWGLSTEMIAFCGYHVTPVDINPDFADLVTRRLADRHIQSPAIVSNFDNVDVQGKQDLVVFYECLHHAVQPWNTLERIGNAIAPGGKIAFAGEPINAYWWHHWGLRLDLMSVYCIRKFGWFESGWTAEFIDTCFERAGWSLCLHQGVGLDGGVIGVASRCHDLEAGIVRPDRHDLIGLPAPQPLLENRLGRLPSAFRAVLASTMRRLGIGVRY